MRLILYHMNKHFILLHAYLIITCFTAIAQGPTGPGSKKEYADFKNETRHLKIDTKDRKSVV